MSPCTYHSSSSIHRFRPFERKTKGYEDIPIHKYGTRGTGVRHETHWEHIPETIPELVVPDLEGFKLKPYVSYRTKEIYQVGWDRKRPRNPYECSDE